MKNKQRRLILSGMLSFALSITCIAGAVTVAGATGAETSKKVDAAYLKEKMSITMDVSPEVKEEYLSKLPEDSGDLVYDLYKIASAKDDGQGLGFEITETFSALSADFNDVKSLKDLDESADYAKESSKRYMAFAQKSLEMLFGGEGSVVTALDSAAKTDCALASKVSDVEPGMYLLVVRGNEPATTEIKTYTVDGGVNEDDMTIAQEGIATVTHKAGYSFIASPMIITFPYKDTLATNGDGEWVFDQKRVLKLKVEPETGSIIIDKTLVGYNYGNENATFVFKVNSYFPDDDTLYSSEVYSIQFGVDDASSKQVQVDGLPIGAKVNVTEIYSGIAYDLVVDSTQTVTVVKTETREDMPVTKFENKRNKWIGGGGGIVNHFEYKAGGLEWTEELHEIQITEDGNVNTLNGKQKK